MNFLKITRRAWLANLSVVTAGIMSLGLPMAAAAEDDVVLGALRFTSHGAGFVAFERGYFKEEGLNVTFEFFQAAQPIAVATASGDVDGLTEPLPRFLMHFDVDCRRGHLNVTAALDVSDYLAHLGSDAIR